MCAIAHVPRARSEWAPSSNLFKKLTIAGALVNGCSGISQSLKTSIHLGQLRETVHFRISRGCDATLSPKGESLPHDPLEALTSTHPRTETHKLLVSGDIRHRATAGRPCHSDPTPRTRSICHESIHRRSAYGPRPTAREPAPSRSGFPGPGRTAGDRPPPANAPARPKTRARPPPPHLPGTSGPAIAAPHLEKVAAAQPTPPREPGPTTDGSALSNRLGRSHLGSLYSLFPETRGTDLIRDRMDPTTRLHGKRGRNHAVGKKARAPAPSQAPQGTDQGTHSGIHPQREEEVVGSG